MGRFHCVKVFTQGTEHSVWVAHGRDGNRHINIQKLSRKPERDLLAC